MATRRVKAEQVEKTPAAPKAEKRKDQDLLDLVRKRFKRAEDAFLQCRNLQREDMRFAEGSPDNQWQWPDREWNDRYQQGRPALTINKLPLHVSQVTNDARQNRPSIKLLAADDKADPQTAEVLNGVIRYIETSSDADTAYDFGIEHSAIHGEGYIRVVTDYADDESFAQDIRIQAIDDPFAIWPDPDAILPEASDAKWWIVETWYSDDEFKARFPKAEAIDWDFSASDKDWSPWFKDGNVRVCEFWYREPVPKTLTLWSDGQTTEGDTPPGDGLTAVRTREVMGTKIVCVTCSPQQVLERKEWAGKLFPFVRVAGRIKKIDGKYEIKGLVRNAKDAQRMYNYWRSQEAEFLGKWTKMPYIAPFEAVEGFENDWAAANRSDKPVLFYNHKDDNGDPLPMPQRVAPPMASSGLMQAVAAASEDIKATTGQFDASLGQRSNETSGRAILARQREGDVANFDFIDNLSKAIRQLGRIIVDLIPKIYDTPRVARVLGEDGQASTAEIDPDLPQAYAERKEADGKISRIYNFGVGKYDVVASVGPSFTTKRQEALAGMTELVQGNPALWQVIGDLLVKNMDWPGAEDMAKRLRAILVPQVQQMEAEGEALPPQVQAQMQQMQQLIDQLGAALEDSMDSIEAAKAEAEKVKSDNDTARVDLEGFGKLIDAYKAETERLKVVSGVVTPDQVQQIVLETLAGLATTPDISPGDAPAQDAAEFAPQETPSLEEPAPVDLGVTEYPAQPALDAVPDSAVPEASDVETTQ